MFNTDTHRFNKALTLLSGFTYNDKPAESTAKSNLTDIFGNQL